MKFFLDTANLDEIRKGSSFGILGTMPYKVFEMLFKHPLTDHGLEMFESDWEKARATLGEIAEPVGAHKGAR